jgi:nitrogen fixation NifU-like protein
VYSETVMDHFRNPRNQGKIDDASGVGEVGNPVCHDMMNIYIKVEKDVITDIKFQTFGCGAAIATSSMITELAKGKTIVEAAEISKKDVADALDGLPAVKMHCSNLAADGLKAALLDWLKKDDAAKARYADLFKRLEDEVRQIREKEKEEIAKAKGEGGACGTDH